MGAYSKVPKGRETTDGGETPGSSATTKEAPKGRQSFNMLFTKQLDVLSPFQGLVLLMRLFRGLTPPSVVYRAFGAFPRTAII